MPINPFNEFAAKLADPLGTQTRAVRKILLLSSLIAGAIAKTGFYPTKINALGVELNPSNKLSILLISGIATGYFLMYFIIPALSNYHSWKVNQFSLSWGETQEAFEDERERKIKESGLPEELKEELLRSDRVAGSIWRSQFHSGRYARAERPTKYISTARLIIEFAFPIFSAITAILLLIMA